MHLMGKLSTTTLTHTHTKANMNPLPSDWVVSGSASPILSLLRTSEPFILSTSTGEGLPVGLSVAPLSRLCVCVSVCISLFNSLTRHKKLNARSKEKSRGERGREGILSKGSRVGCVVGPQAGPLTKTTHISRAFVYYQQPPQLFHFLRRRSSRRSARIPSGS